MGSIQKFPLSGSIAGRPVHVTVTASAGLPIHTTTTSSAVVDEVWLYSSYIGSGTPSLTLEWGGTSNPNDRIQTFLTGSTGLFLLAPGLILTASGSTASTIRAFASTGSGIVLTGYVNRYTP